MQTSASSKSSSLAPLETVSPVVEGARSSSGAATAQLRRPLGMIAVFLAPALLMYSLLFGYPMLRAMYLSLYRGSPSSESFAYVGFENYRQLLFHDAVFWQSLWHNIQFVVIAGSATLILALAISFGLTRCGRGRDFFRLVFLFPNIMSIVATTILWSFIFNPSFGMLNGLLRALHLPFLARAWLGEPSTALYAIMAVHVWSSVGFYIVLFYAGMLRVPADYSDAARIDGASMWQEFYHITLPLLAEVMKIASVYVVVNAVNVFALVYVMNETQPNRYNGVLLTYMHEQAFKNSNYGYACAIGVSILFLVLVVAFLVNSMFRKEVVEL